MGESERHSDYRRRRNRISLGSEGNALVGLFTINVIFFLTLITIRLVYYFFQEGRILSTHRL